jgi:hypothetical protein
MFYTELDKSEYFDLTVTKDCRDFYRDYSECHLIKIDVTEGLCSRPGIVQTTNVSLDYIGLNGYDNFFIPNGNGTIDPEITYIVESGDTFCFHEVSGYTGQFTYEIDHMKLDNGKYYNQLLGGFYQGFYKIYKQPVEWFPTRGRKGFSVNMLLHFPMITTGVTTGDTTGVTTGVTTGTTTGTTLNDVFTGNTGFIFYIGTRAENKYADKTVVEVKKLNDNYSIIPKELQNIYTYNGMVTLNGFSKYIGYFNYYNGLMYTGRRYTPQSQVLQYHQEYSDLYYNAFGIRITNDGRIGYRTIYPTDICYTGETQEVSGITTNSFVLQPDDPCVNHTVSLIVTKYFTIEEGYTKKPVIDVNEKKFLHVSAVFERDFGYNDSCELLYGKYRRGTLSIYLNGFLVLRHYDFVEVTPHELDVADTYQQGVPFNISFGGGTQNLLDALYLDETKKINTVLEKFFAGTFLGGVKDFQMYCVPLYSVEVKKIVNTMANIYDLRTIKGGRKIFINKLF